MECVLVSETMIYSATSTKIYLLKFFARNKENLNLSHINVLVIPFLSVTRVRDKNIKYPSSFLAQLYFALLVFLNKDFS